MSRDDVWLALVHRETTTKGSVPDIFDLTLFIRPVFFDVVTSAVMVTDKSPEKASPIIPGPLGPTSPPKE